MKIVCWIPKVYGGTGLYRIVMPHEVMADVVFTDSVKYQDLLGDIFIVSKANFTSIMPVLAMLRANGVKTIVDYDDYWALPTDHLLYGGYKRYNTTKLLVESLSKFDYVTTTTYLLATEIRKFNPNVVVLENAVNTDRAQYRVNVRDEEDVSFGWIGGHCHLPDIKLLAGTPERLATTDGWKIRLFGHDGRDGSIYNEFANVMCGYGQALNRFSVYRAASSDTYTQFYNMIDVALIPLVDNKFNSMKSELKMVESAFFKKACIVSNVMPYRKWITPKNCLKVDNKTDWYKHMRRLILNKSLATDLGNQLYEDLHEHFDIKNVNKRRVEFYRSIV